MHLVDPLNMAQVKVDFMNPSFTSSHVGTTKKVLKLTLRFGGGGGLALISDNEFMSETIKHGFV